MFPVPFNDAQRLEVLAGYDVLDSPPEEVFDSLTRLATRHFGTPVALVSLVDEARQWFKSVQGLDTRETDRALAFCGHAIMSEEPLVVLDAAADARFAENALVCDSPGIRFYAGAPLITPQGFRLGTFCVIDMHPRNAFGNDELTALVDFATAAMLSLNARRLAHAQQKTNEAEIAQDCRVALFSTVAHEIRSPVAALKGCLGLLQSEVYGPIENQQHKGLLGAMTETIDDVMTMTDRMLNLARLRTGDVELLEEWSCVTALMEKARRRSLFAKSNRKPDIRIEGTASGIQLNADTVQMTQMLGNLINNAIKYSDGPPEIRLSAAMDCAGTLEIAVTDSGIGIAEQDIALALRPYTQINRPGNKAVCGVGIGLPLVKQLIELHGGRLRITSAEGKGTKVSLLFPHYRVSQSEEQRRA